MARRICRTGNRRTCIPGYSTRSLTRKPGQGGGYKGELPVIPQVAHSAILMHQRDGILVIWDRPMMVTCDIKDQINVIVDGAAPVHPKSVEFNQTDHSQMGIIMDVPFTEGQVVTWAYDDQGPCDLQEVRAPNTEADNQTYAVNNMIHTPAISEDFVGACSDPLHEMFLQLKGTGLPTTGHTSDIYQPDHDGVFHAFPADQPVWRGGRLAHGSVYSTDATGNPIATALHYQNVATNLLYPNRDLSNDWVVATDGIVGSTEFTKAGITGNPNTASVIKITDNSTGTYYEYTRNIPISIPNVNSTSGIYVKKQQGVGVKFSVWLDGSSLQRISFILNCEDGSVILSTSHVDDPLAKVISVGDWWLLLISGTDKWASTHITVRVSGSLSLANDTPIVDEIVVDTISYYNDKAIEEVENLGPIFTDGTAVSTDRINYEYDVANLNNDSGAVYMEIEPSPGLIAGTFLGYGFAGDNTVNGNFDTNMRSWSTVGTWQWEAPGVCRHIAGGDKNFYQAHLGVVGKASLVFFELGDSNGVCTAHFGAAPAHTLNNSGYYAITDKYTVHSSLSFQSVSDFSGFIDNVKHYRLDGTNNFTLFDHTGTAIALPGIADQVNKVGVRWNSTDSLMSIMVNGVWSADVPYSGKISEDFKMFTAMEGAASVHCIRAWGGGHYADLKQAIDNQFASGSPMASAFDAGFDSGFK